MRVKHRAKITNILIFSYLSLPSCSLFSPTYFVHSHSPTRTPTGLFKVYSAVPHKESIHITTPSWKDFDSPFPNELNKWCSLWDEVSVELMQAMAGN